MFASLNLSALALFALATIRPASAVRGTYWSTQSDGGGCQVPEGTYTIPDAVALGQSRDLGGLIYRPGLCGKVLTIQCGGQSVDAVIASTCNLGSDSCGVDLIARTWKTATGGKPPGVADCSVKLSGRNPLAGAGPVCYTRPNSGGGSPYYYSLGVLNTGTEIPKSATLAGVAGTWANGAWFQFNSGGRPLFVPGARFEVTYESGRKASFDLGQCKPSSGVHIFQ
ncbi:uncharacterized protein EV422DRAFT_538678 [Fimicolochytrium jonesii]|uniref:uncharacterized protein n=1 Tax=Fimicolochytrium jonesii TaxID=1396493 RepID=UPI0022FF05C6|nr:uncharacterized protein EV422DRAFT_538678 [Fimicolochytrium jonesii]KAI8818082.1 hypothetical protein EV422DRAFT_538678 [Fimicolochytrium jonesii]